MDKNKKAEQLLNSIGNIDDRLLDEAIEYKPARRLNTHRWGLAAACIAIVSAIAISLPMLRKMEVSMDKSEMPKDSAVEDVTHNSANNEESVEDSNGGNGNFVDKVENDALCGYLLGIRGSSLEDCTVYPSVEAVDLSLGASLIWQYAEGGDVYSAAISASELDELMSAIGGKEVGASSPTLSCRVWIVDEQGRVISPYLKRGAGNESCSIFYYDAEIIPGDKFVGCVSEILG